MVNEATVCVYLDGGGGIHSPFYYRKQQIWLQNALGELIDIPAALNTDNNGSIDLTNNPRISDKSKHIDIAYHHVRDVVEIGKVNLLHVASTDNLADICTKPLPRPQFLNLGTRVLGPS